MPNAFLNLALRRHKSLNFTISPTPDAAIPSTVHPEPQKFEGRLLLVSNRLPITIKRGKDTKYETSMSSGGLVSGLSGLKKTTTFQWYGWPGLEVPENDIKKLKNQLKREYNAVPVLLDDRLADKHYNGFSSKSYSVIIFFEYELIITDMILWPLLHYHSGEIDFNETSWKAYIEVNRLFAKTVAADVQDNDLVWVHDYHLMLLPTMLRREIGTSKKNVKIGFFLHTPFPSSEIFRTLPVRNEILLGLLKCDLIGFHTIDYARHFLNSCEKLL